jgi:formylglycine-generating enzyme
VTWQEAYAFCIWDGGFLPSDAEWGYAAAGGSEQREYPWGAADPGSASEYAIYFCLYPGGARSDGGQGLCTGTVANIAPVGTAQLGAGRWNQLDLAGNLTEYALDWYTRAYVDPCADCAALAATGGRVVRGGNFGEDDDEQALLSTGRGSNGNLPGRDGGFGFRCARTP